MFFKYETIWLRCWITWKTIRTKPNLVKTPWSLPNTDFSISFTYGPIAKIPVIIVKIQTINKKMFIM